MNTVLTPETLPLNPIRSDVPSYVLFGDDPWYVSDCARRTLTALEKRDYAVTRFQCDAQFDWDQLEGVLNQGSLFSQKTALGLRITTDTLAKPGQTLLSEYFQQPNPDTILVISFGALDKATQARKWFKQIACGITVQANSLKHRALTHWLQGRAARYPLNTTPDALEQLAELTSGNMGAAAQGLELLYLSYGNTTAITPTHVLETISTGAHYTLFQLTDACLHGNARLAFSHLAQLEQTHAPTLVLWALAREIRTLFSIQSALHAGNSFASALKHLHIPNWRAETLRNAMSRFETHSLAPLLSRCHQIDLMIKGVNLKENPWLAFKHLCLALSGAAYLD